ncbi:penicillin-binding protein activator [Rhodospirillum rubrum]|nr:penicillin-binding protein activator [Rhodospirillum rubrum]MBK1678341.1 penicillin-binding protein activator [Rhodospirillum rubrum]
MVAGLVVAGLALAACAPRFPSSAPPPPGPPPARAEGSGADHHPPADGPLTVALLLPLSGKAGAIGGRLRTAAETMAETTPNRLRLIAFDTQGPQGAVTAARAAIAAHADLIVGPLFGRDAQAVRPIVEEAGLTALALTNNASAGGARLWALGHAPEPQVRRVLALAAGRGEGRVMVIGPDTAYARLALTQARAMAAEAGGVTVVGASLYPPGTPYGALAESLRAMVRTPADVVLIPAGGLDLIAVSSVLAYYGETTGHRPVGTDLWEGPRPLSRETSLRGGWFTSANPFPAFPPSAETVAGSPDGGAAQRRDPDKLEALVMDGVAVAQAWDRVTPLAEFLERPGGFSGASGVFRLGPQGDVERAYGVMEIGSDETIALDPPLAVFPAGGSPLGLGRATLPPEDSPASEVPPPNAPIPGV